MTSETLNGEMLSSSTGLSDRLSALAKASTSLLEGTNTSIDDAVPSLKADTGRRSGFGGTTAVECHQTSDGNTEVNTTLQSNPSNPFSRMRGGYVIRTEGTGGEVNVSGGINPYPLGTSTVTSQTILPGRVDGVQVTGGAQNLTGGMNVIKPTSTSCSPERQR